VSVRLRRDAVEVERFAAKLLTSLTAGEQLRSEMLAEAVRSEYQLGAFPKLPELEELLRRLGIVRHRLVPGSGFPGLNVWAGSAAPEVHIDESARVAFQETTIAHELREVIENACRRASPEYPAVPTHDNRRMNPKSDRFGSYLLMETQASARIFAKVGFDPLTFARQVGRSLPSVVVRMQTLFPGGTEFAAPMAGIWLFDSKDGRAAGEDLVARISVSLNGFSAAKSDRIGVAARVLAPEPRARAGSHPDVRDVVLSRQPSVLRTQAVDLFGDLSYAKIIEPVVRNGDVKAVVFALVHAESLPLMQPWVRRLGSV
jgi:hypothetical protein